MVEFTGYEFGAQQIQWESELLEQFNRREQRGSTDERIERQQKLQRELRKVEAKVEQLQQENERLRLDNDQLRLRCEKHEKRSPLTIESMKTLSLRHAAVMLLKFSGSEGVKFADAWLKSIDRSAEALDWTEAEKFLVGSVALEGAARHWLVARRRDISTWAEFKVAFKSRYANSEIDEEVGPVSE